MTAGNWKIKIGPNGRGTIELDGVRLENVRAVTARVGVNEVPVVTLEVIAGSVEFEGQAEIVKKIAPPPPAPPGTPTHFCSYWQAEVSIPFPCPDCNARTANG